MIKSHRRALGRRTEMKVLLISVFSLIVLDAGLTYLGVTKGYAEEANPLVKSLMHNYPGIVCGLTVVIAAVLTYKLWQHRDKTKHIKGFVIGLLITKVAIIINHIVLLSQL